MLIIIAITIFAVWLAFFVKYNSNQSSWTQIIRKYFYHGKTTRYTSL
jgi:hypothetical protein